MKKRIFVAVLSVLLSACILLLLPGPESTIVPTTVPTGTVPTRPTTPTQPTGTAPTLSEAPGRVTLYTCDPVMLEVYQELAVEYAALTGTEIIVLDSGEKNCADALAQHMAGDNPPTVFCIHNENDLAQYQQQLYDLTGTALLEQLCSPAFGLTVDGKVLGVATDTEGFGLIYNAGLLANLCSRTDFFDYSMTLKAAVAHIQGNKFDFGGANAFGHPDFSEDSSMAALLAMLHPDAADLRSFLDIYSSGMLQSGDALNQFLSGKSVFYLGGTGDYDKVDQLGDSYLDILPAFHENGGSLHCTVGEYWVVRGDAAAQDISASLRFLQWLVTAPEGAAAPVDRLELLSPFQDAAYYRNSLEKKLRGYIVSEPVSVGWADALRRDTVALGAALEAYLAAPGEDTWQAVAVWLP